MMNRLLRRWFYRNRRDLPWRMNPSPYEVWVSEVMLQQTQVSVVIPYFKRWMEKFPSVEALAGADMDEVIKAWEGLGYYSRARNLVRGAQYLVEKRGGEVPEVGLSEVPGIGPYTEGAILSFAFRKKAVAVDGNVLRVISRLFRIEEEIETAGAKRRVGEAVWGLLGDDEPWVVMEALIELGALVCQKRPKCEECPLGDVCLGRGMDLPRKKKRVGVTLLEKKIAVVESRMGILVGKRGKGVMEDLWEFPERHEVEHLGLDGGKGMEKVQHSFTRYRATLFPERFWLDKGEDVANYEWIPKEELLRLPFSSGHRQILGLL